MAPISNPNQSNQTIINAAMSGNMDVVTSIIQNLQPVEVTIHCHANGEQIFWPIPTFVRNMLEALNRYILAQPICDPSRLPQ